MPGTRGGYDEENSGVMPYASVALAQPTRVIPSSDQPLLDHGCLALGICLCSAGTHSLSLFGELADACLRCSSARRLSEA